ncbi:probable N-acetyltransferase 16 isoform X2 [Rhinatrema bivittatum]|nr:probable N-acetyltransferase 16 [Rhinatrema bivittatum]XP_029437690.1 probable N-acetyltransferase 16 [Rhinatrema bivittatum]XP_029441951.1 probable N-acetyltransferase 16 isoform X2 [Rhinatrema bivittatum]
MKLDAALTLDLGPIADAELEFVVASEKEYEEVMAMSEGIYGGLDYLPSRYHSWIKEPDRTVILAKKDGEVVSRCIQGQRCRSPRDRRIVGEYPVPRVLRPPA